MIPNINPNWSQRGPKMKPESLKNMSWKHLVPKVAPNWPPNPLRWLPRSLQTPSGIDFGRGFGPIWGACSSIVQPILDDFCMPSSAACCKQRR